MANLIIEVPDDLARGFDGIAAAQHKSIQQLAIERLSSLVEVSRNIARAPPPQYCEPCRNRAI